MVWWEGLRTAELLLPFPDFILLQLQNRPVYKNSNLLLSVWSMFWKKKNPTTWKPLGYIMLIKSTLLGLGNKNKLSLSLRKGCGLG